MKKLPLPNPIHRRIIIPVQDPDDLTCRTTTQGDLWFKRKNTPVSKIKQNNGRIILACEEWQVHHNNFNKKVADTRKGTLPLR